MDGGLVNLDVGCVTIWEIAKMSDEIEKNKKILDAYKKRIGLNLDRIPQGPGSRLDADTVNALFHVQVVVLVLGLMEQSCQLPNRLRLVMVMI